MSGTCALDNRAAPMDAVFVRNLYACSFAMLMFVACSPKSDPVSTNEVLAPGDEAAVRVITPAQDRELIEAMLPVVHGDVEHPAPARDGMRWKDVPEAARIAADAVDMAIVTKQLDDGTWRFHVVTARDEPGELVVERRPSPTVVFATASVGAFGERGDDAKRYVEEFMRVLRLLGKKPGFDE